MACGRLKILGAGLRGDSAGELFDEELVEEGAGAGGVADEPVIDGQVDAVAVGWRVVKVGDAGGGQVSKDVRELGSQWPLSPLQMTTVEMA